MMKKLVTLLLTLALCLPMALTSSVEVRASETTTYTCSHSMSENGSGKCQNLVDGPGQVCGDCSVVTVYEPIDDYEQEGYWHKYTKIICQNENCGWILIPEENDSIQIQNCAFGVTQGVGKCDCGRTIPFCKHQCGHLVEKGSEYCEYCSADCNINNSRVIILDENTHQLVTEYSCGGSTQEVKSHVKVDGYCSTCGYYSSNGNSSEGDYRLEIQGPEHNYLVSYGNSVYEEFEQTKLVLTCPNGKVISYQIPVANGAWDISSYLVGSGEYAIAMYVGENVVAAATRYIYGQSSDGGAPSVSGNSGPKPTAPAPVYTEVAPTEAEVHAQKAAQVEAKQKKVVTTASGEVVKTAIAGVYEVSSLSGTAVNTPKAEVQKAIGLSDEEIAAGTNASIYMSDFVSKEDRAALNNAAASVGKNVLSMIVSDMYSITKDGKITKLHSSKEPVSLMFGLPKYAVDANRTYSMICVTADGKVVELKDTDNDPSTLTVDTTVFGKYVIVY